MQLFAVALAATGQAPDLDGAVRAAAAPFPDLAGQEIHTGRSDSGAVSFAHVHHSDRIAAPRRYAAWDGPRGVLVDGFPVDREVRFAAHDAAELLARWSDAEGQLEGLFSAVLVDLADDAIELQLDVLGMTPVYAHRRDGVTVVSNSVEALRTATRASDPDGTAIASMLVLGWPLGRGLVAGAEQLPGGAVHRLTRDGMSSRTFFAPADILVTAPPSIEEVAERMLRSVRSIASTGTPVASAISSGRDTRLLLALLLASGTEASYYTSGVEGDPDVVISRLLAKRWRLRHEVLDQIPPADLDTWEAETDAFVRRNDGLASVESINDHLDHDGPAGRLSVELWGTGGEIARTSWGWYTQPLGGLVPVARRSWDWQRAIIARSFRDGGGLITGESIARVAAWLDDFLADRRAEGWPAAKGFPLYYAFNRVRWWAGRGIRRASPTADLYGPFITRSYISHGLHRTPGELWTEQVHRRLIDRFWPDVGLDPYEVPWRPQVPRAALGLHLGETAWFAVKDRLSRTPDPHGPAFGPIWFETGLPVHRALAESTPDSPLWRYVDRERYLGLLRGTPEQRAGSGHLLSRILTVLWYLHGRR